MNNAPIEIVDTPDSSSNIGVGLRDADIDKVLDDVQAITGEPVRKKRGRKPKSESPTREEGTPLPFDAAQIEPILISTYLQLLSIFARVPIVITTDQKEGIGPLLTHCANQYIPGDSNKHLPAVGLVLMTFEIVRQSRENAKALEESQDGNKES